MPEKLVYSQKAKELVKEFIARLEEIPDGCAEMFPFDMIDRLKKEYLEFTTYFFYSLCCTFFIIFGNIIPDILQIFRYNRINPQF